MPFDAVYAAELLAAEVSGCVQPGPEGWPEGAPSRDLSRSPVAARVGRLAASQGLCLYHYEHRDPPPLPEDFVPEHAPELSDPPAWVGGVLPERKYQSFRHDQAIGSFHPGMRAKWTAHELTHALVGFAWAPGASPLFLATAGRLAELLPVALWYFLDEAHLHRCPLHRQSGPLFRGLCLDCEALAEARVDDLFAAAHLDGGRLFIERELQAIRRTRTLGQPVPHIHGSLDLCSDGLAYAAAHGPRLRSEAFERFADGFLVEGGGWVRTLDALERRVIAVLDALVGDPSDPETALPALAPTSEHGRARWVLQDVGWRLLEVWHQTDGEAADALLHVVDALAQACQHTTDASRAGSDVAQTARRALAQSAHDYAVIVQDYELPESDRVFALGHPLLGALDPGDAPRTPLHRGRAHALLLDGVISALPSTARVAQHRLPDLVADFALDDVPARVPLGRRFATWLTRRTGGALTDLARFEAELAHLPPRDLALVALGSEPRDGAYRLARGVVVMRFAVDPVALEAAADFGDLVLDDALQIHDVDGAPIPEQPTAVALSRAVDGSAQVRVVDAPTAHALLSLGSGAVPDLSPDILADLCALGVLRPAAWVV